MSNVIEKLDQIRSLEAQLEAARSELRTLAEGTTEAFQYEGRNVRFVKGRQGSYRLMPVERAKPVRKAKVAEVDSTSESTEN